MPRIAAVVVLVLLSACAGGRTALLDPPPVAQVLSTSGTARLDVEVATVGEAAEPGGLRWVGIQAAVVADGDVIVAEGASGPVVLRDGVKVDGARADPLHGRRPSLSATIPFDGVEPSLAGVAIECRLVHVTAWAEHAASGIGTGGWDAAVERDAPPWTLRCAYEAETGRVAVAIGATHAADLLRYVTHSWASGAVRGTDARGDPLVSQGGAGTGGSAVAWLGRADPFDARPIVPPFTVGLRVPAAWTVETVAFPLDAVPATSPPPR